MTEVVCVDTCSLFIDHFGIKPDEKSSIRKTSVIKYSCGAAYVWQSALQFSQDMNPNSVPDKTNNQKLSLVW